jgi:hypothetical protein
LIQTFIDPEGEFLLVPQGFGGSMQLLGVRLLVQELENAGEVQIR